MTHARTRVGSGRARRLLPMGREAVERALATCEHFGCDNATDACCKVFDIRSLAGLSEYRIAGAAEWLPYEIRWAPVAELRELLKSMS